MARRKSSLGQAREALGQLRTLAPSQAQRASRQIASDVVAAVRLHTTKAVETLKAALDATTPGKLGPVPDWRARIRAAEVLLDRGYGRAPQLVAHATRLDDDTLRRAVEAIAARRGVVVEGGQLGAPTPQPKPKRASPVPQASQASPMPTSADTSAVPSGGYVPVRPPGGVDKGPPSPKNPTESEIEQNK